MQAFDNSTNKSNRSNDPSLFEYDTYCYDEETKPKGLRKMYLNWLIIISYLELYHLIQVTSFAQLQSLQEKRNIYRA
ncbi:hypothetical protein AYI69_g8495 [Smittium culicis]|uniref:Uncharacterized protein n=1 Tax=Smittium culicis TaxID=133412 RepID=A0A1R1XJ66_9FUNG|nr:hypothetical protein AYI69_g8495 [Smittium culicis]